MASSSTDPPQETIERTRLGEAWLVRVSGELNDKVDSTRLHAGLDGLVVLDLDGLTRVTSYGVREWMRGLAKLRADYYCFLNCRPAMVAQFNMIAGFAGRGELVSLYLPFVCEECDHEFEVLSDLRRDYPKFASGTVPEASCPECESAAEFDDLPNYYFSYLLGCRPPSPPAAVAALIDGDENASVVEARVRKVVRGRVTAVHLEGDIDKKLRLRRRLMGLEGLVLVDMRRVTSISNDALVELHKISEDPAVTRLDLVDVPEGVFDQIQAHFPTTESTGVVSFSLRGWCDTCESDRDGTLRLVQGRRETDTFKEVVPIVATAECRVCRGGLSHSLVDAELECRREQLGQLPLAEISNYLDYRSDIYSDDGSGNELPTADLERLSAYRYEVVRRLDAGGMAEVFLAHQRGPQGFHKEVALKRILPELSERKSLLEMFLREARIAAQVSHPNVVQIFDLGRDADGFYIAMEYVEGWNLGQVLRMSQQLRQPVPVNIAIRIASDICAGLHGAHTTTGSDGVPLGIVHRDVSQNNVLISKRGMVKVADFGVARAAVSDEDAAPGTVRGKIMYLAPELVHGGPGEAGPASDIFAAGVVIYQSLSGRALFRRDNDYNTVKAILNDRIAPLSELRSDIPPGLDEIIAKALARPLEERCSSALELHHDLENLLVKLGLATTSTDVAEWAGSVMIDGETLLGIVSGAEAPSATEQARKRSDAVLTSEDGPTPTLTQTQAHADEFLDRETARPTGKNDRESGS